MRRLAVGLVGPGLIGKALVAQLRQQVGSHAESDPMRCTRRRPGAHASSTRMPRRARHRSAPPTRSPLAPDTHPGPPAPPLPQTPYLAEHLGLQLALVAVANSRRQLLADAGAPLQAGDGWQAALAAEVRAALWGGSGGGAARHTGVLRPCGGAATPPHRPRWARRHFRPRPRTPTPSRARPSTLPPSAPTCSRSAAPRRAASG